MTEPISQWHEAKTFIEHALAVDHDTIHLIAGFLLWIAVAAVLRRPLTSWTPWIAVLVAELANEWGDLLVERWPSEGMQFGEAAKDIALTLFIPTVMMVVARINPRLIRR